MANATSINCPVCRKPVEAAYRPFCSKRCADIDLGRWFGETYAMPTEEAIDMVNEESGE
jgi:endogenous inhibitor of DNA gyrase (YacG/DUF329 family)